MYFQTVFLTWQISIHSSIPPSTWNLSDGRKSSQSWAVKVRCFGNVWSLSIVKQSFERILIFRKNVWETREEVSAQEHSLLSGLQANWEDRPLSMLRTTRKIQTTWLKVKIGTRLKWAHQLLCKEWKLKIEEYFQSTLLGDMLSAMASKSCQWTMRFSVFTLYGLR